MKDLQAGNIAIKYRKQKSRKRCELKLSDNLVVSLSTGFEIFSLPDPCHSTSSTPLLLPLSRAIRTRILRIEEALVADSLFSVLSTIPRFFSFDPLAFPSPRSFFPFFSPSSFLYRWKRTGGLQPSLLSRPLDSSALFVRARAALDLVHIRIINAHAVGELVGARAE